MKPKKQKNFSALNTEMIDPKIIKATRQKTSAIPEEDHINPKFLIVIPDATEMEMAHIREYLGTHKFEDGPLFINKDIKIYYLDGEVSTREVKQMKELISFKAKKRFRLPRWVYGFMLQLTFLFYRFIHIFVNQEEKSMTKFQEDLRKKSEEE